MRYLQLLLFLTIFNTLTYCQRNSRPNSRGNRGQPTDTNKDTYRQNGAGSYNDSNTQRGGRNGDATGRQVAEEVYIEDRARGGNGRGRGNGRNTGGGQGGSNQAGNYQGGSNEGSASQDGGQGRGNEGSTTGGGQGRGDKGITQSSGGQGNGKSLNRGGGKKVQEKTDEDFLYSRSGKRKMPHGKDMKVARKDDVKIGGRHFKRYQEEVDGVPVMNSRQVTMVRGRSTVTGEEQESSVGNRKARNFRSGNARRLAHARELPLGRLRAACVAKSGGKSTREKIFLDGEKQLYQSPKGDEHLVRILQFESEQGNDRGACLIDAVSGRVLKNWDPRKSIYRTEGDGGNIKTGKWRHASGGKYPGLPTKQVASKCLYQTDRVTVFDAKNSASPSFYDSNIFNVNCGSESQDATNGGFSPANDVFFAADKYAEMMRSWLQTYDWMPGNRTARLAVHVGNSMQNAYWSPASNYLAFGDGAGTFYPLTNQDIVFHEMAHAFTDRYSQLIYDGESGCINEAYSDITGMTGTSFISGQPVSEWSIGGDSMKGSGALRYLDDPSRDLKSIYHVDRYYNGLDTHYCSGVYNYVFYNLVKREGMPIERAWKLFATANMLLWTEETTMREGACDVITVAAQLGYSEVDITRLLAAFSTSGLGSTCEVTGGGTSTGVTELQSGVAVSGVAETESDYRYFTITLPAVTTSQEYDLTITTSGSNGDADLFVQKDRQATNTDYLKKSSSYTSNEEIIFSPAPAGVYHIAVLAYDTFSNLEVKATYVLSSPVTPPPTGSGSTLQNCNQIALSPGLEDSVKHYTIAVPTGTGSITFSTGGGQGDPDLYVKLGSQPTTSSYTWRSWIEGTPESISKTAPTGGTYYVMIHAYADYSGVWLKACYQGTSEVASTPTRQRCRGRGNRRRCLVGEDEAPRQRFD